MQGVGQLTRVETQTVTKRVLMLTHLLLLLDSPKRMKGDKREDAQGISNFMKPRTEVGVTQKTSIHLTFWQRAQCKSRRIFV